MHDDLSPEEKLLRLIKGEKQSAPEETPDTPAQPAPKDTGASGDTPSDEQSSASEPDKKKPDTPDKKDTPKDAQPPEKPLIIPDSKSGRRDKKTPHKPVSPDTVIPDRSAKPDQPAPTPEPQPAAAAEPTPQADQPQAEPAAEAEQGKPRRHGGGLIGFFAWLLSGFTFINWLLILVLIASIGLTVYHFDTMSQQRTVPMAAQPMDVPEILPEKAPDDGLQFAPQPFPYYMEVISSKNLFRLVKPPPPPKPPEPEIERPKEPEIKIETLTRHLVLQGIVYDIDPPQAIIFDKKENKTLFLGNGEMVTDQVKLKQIQRGKVILEYEEQTQELTF